MPASGLRDNHVFLLTSHPAAAFCMGMTPILVLTLILTVDQYPDHHDPHC